MAKLFDKIIARMLKKRDFLKAMKADPAAAVDDEFGGGKWALGLTAEQRNYFEKVLDYDKLIAGQDGLDDALDPYSSSHFFITD